MGYLGDAFSPPPSGVAPAAPPAKAPSVPIAPPLPEASPLSVPDASPPELATASGGDAPVAAAEEPTAETLVVAVTPRAAQEVRRIVEEQKLAPTTGLRLGVQGGGCSGFSYKLGFEAMKAPLDWEGESQGIKIFVDPKSFLYLSGVELDFQDSLMGRGFVFNNPNAKKTCGCGESFQV